MSPQERAPRKRLASARGRFDTVLPQEALDRRASHVEAEVAQRPAQAGELVHGWTGTSTSVWRADPDMDSAAQTAAKLVLEPIFEAGFKPTLPSEPSGSSP
jgi:hypothetical protein